MRQAAIPAGRCLGGPHGRLTADRCIHRFEPADHVRHREHMIHIHEIPLLPGDSSVSQQR